MIDLTISEAITAIGRNGWHVMKFTDGRINSHEICTLAKNAEFRPSSVGRLQTNRQDPTIRSDALYWIENQTNPNLQAYLDLIEHFRCRINQHLMLGIFDYECHFAHYPPGAFYKKHLDAFADNLPTKGNRKISTILYLNEDWQPGDGGELVIYKPNSDEELIRVEPKLGTLVMFLSEEFPHEVLPTHKDRWSLTGWFRTRGDI